MSESKKNIPQHIGIIMDGNGRWANIRGKERTYGHKKGSENVDRIVSHAFNRGVKAVTLYAFSSENWSRPQKEVDALMRLLESYFNKFVKKAEKNGVRLTVIGDKSVLSEKLREVISNAENLTKVFSDKILNIAVNYGGRQEIVYAVNKLIESGKNITVDGISENLYTAKSGDPDLIIRTGGEYRISNFMLYSCAYSELYFTEVLWPDFNEEEFDKALENFNNRERRFGGVNNK